MTQTAMPAAPSMPTRVGRYELRHPLGTGGMASVHLAVARTDAGHQEAYALKRMHPHLAQIRSYAAMFVDEARIASRIAHPNVCAVVDFGADGGEHFLAMELLLGEHFGKLIARLRRLPQADGATARRLLVSLIADACEGVHAAHELQAPDGTPMHVVHRDISPHNLLVTYDGRMKVLDFGVARAVGQQHRTVTGEVKGKFSYMAPEQMRGEALDRRADVWALGVVLWEALAMRPLFRRATQSETVLAVLAAEVPSLSECVPGIGADLEAIVCRALTADPTRRYPTARALARDLRAWSSTQGAVPHAGHVARWMAALFPEEHAAKQRLVQDVIRAPAEGAVHHVAEAPTMESRSTPSASMVVERRGRPPGADGDGASAPRRGWAGWLWAPVALAAVAGIALVVAAVQPRVVLSANPVAERADEAPETTPTRAVGAASVGAEASMGPSAPAAVAPPSPMSAPDEDRSAEARGAPAGSATADGPSQGEVETPSAAKPTRVTAPSRRRSRGTGQVNVAVRGGWAHVYVGRRRLGPTPGTYRLPAGRHVLRLRGDDGRVLARVPVRIDAGDTAQVAVALD